MLETSVARRMEQNHNQHDLRHRHFAITMVVSLFSVGLSYAFGRKACKSLPKFIQFEENLYNLAFSEHRGWLLLIFVLHHKYTKTSPISLIFSLLYIAKLYA